MTDAWNETPDDVAEFPAAGDDISGEVEEAGIPDEPEVFVEEIQAEAVSSDGTDGTDGRMAAEVPETGDPRVDEVLHTLSGIENRPLAEHVGVYDEVHRGLQDALANLDQG